MPPTPRANLVIILAFVLVAGALTVRHEPWNDEAQAWLLARDTPDLGALYHRMGYEGSPMLWHLILRIPAKLGLTFWAAQVINLIFALATVVLIVTRAPFPLLHRALLSFGYYTVYEYAAIARCYSLTALLLLCAAWLYPLRASPRAWLLGLVLALLANTCTPGMVIALVFLAVWAVEVMPRRPRAKPRGQVVALVLAAAGIGLCIWQLQPAPDIAPNLGRWKTDLGTLPGRIARATWHAFLPFPQPEPHFWNQRPPVPRDVIRIAAVVLLALTALSLRKRPAALAIYLGTCMGLFAIFWLKYAGAWRHHGLIFVAFIACLWMVQAEGSLRARAAARKSLSGRWASRALAALLAVHVLGASIAASYDLQYEFAPGRRAAKWLEAKGYLAPDVLIATFFVGPFPALADLQDRDVRFFQLHREKFASYQIWDQEAWDNTRFAMPMTTALARLDKQIARGGYRRVLLLFDANPGDRDILDRRFQFREAFESPVTGLKNYAFELKQGALGLPSPPSRVGRASRSPAVAIPPLKREAQGPKRHETGVGRAPHGSVSAHPTGYARVASGLDPRAG